MAMTHDYLDYLNQRVGIAPANSQEELQAAQTIADLMSHHDLEPSVEEFDAPSLAGLGPALLSILMFLGVLVSGMGVVALAVVGLVLALIPTLLVVMSIFGRSPSLSVGPSARSQNVIAIHRATGPLVAKGNRPIVVVAHYDTPRENFLYSTALAPYLPLLVRVAALCRYAVALCAFVQVLAFLPAPARLVLWLVGIVAALPGLLLAVGSIYERVSPCTLGANDNKSAVASLLGVMENVRPSGFVPTPREPVSVPDVEEPEDVTSADDAREAEDEDVAASDSANDDERLVPEPAPSSVETHGVRHGEDVLRSLEILPAECEIEYVAPASPAPAPAAPVPVVEPAPADATAPLFDGAALSNDAPAGSVGDEPEAPAEGTAPLAPVAAEAETTRDDLLSGGRFSIVMDDGSHSVGPKDSSGLTADIEVDQPEPQQPAPRPAAPDDPEWGRASYRPQVSNVARRASLFDLPDPSLGESDPLGDPNATRVTPRSGNPAAPVEPVQTGASEKVSAPQPIETLASTAARGKSALGGLLGKVREAIASKAERSKGSDDRPDDWLGSADDDTDDPVWKGGAATRAGLRFVDEEEQAPSDEEMTEEILSLGDDALISHDIWFVALGGSSLDHAGMRAFLQRHRQEIRGCFVVNLDCVGAGDLCVLTHEGIEGTRRADRRLGRILTGVAHDLHTELSQKSFEWSSTDALPAMSSSIRSVTIMGMNEAGLPALSHTPDDVAENVSGDQAALVTEIVTETIRRA